MPMQPRTGGKTSQAQPTLSSASTRRCSAGLFQARALLEGHVAADELERALRAGRQLDVAFAKRLRPLAPAHDMRGPGKARSESRQQQVAARRDAAFLKRLDECNWHGRRGHVAVALDIHETALHRYARTFHDCLD